MTRRRKITDPKETEVSACRYVELLRVNFANSAIADTLVRAAAELFGNEFGPAKLAMAFRKISDDLRAESTPGHAAEPNERPEDPPTSMAARRPVTARLLLTSVRFRPKSVNSATRKLNGGRA